MGGGEDDPARDEVDEVDVDEDLAEGVGALAERERQVRVDVLEEHVAVGHHAALRVHPLLGRFSHDVEKLYRTIFGLESFSDMIYRVTIQVVTNLPLTSKQKFRFSIMPMYTKTQLLF